MKKRRVNCYCGGEGKGRARVSYSKLNDDQHFISRRTIDENKK